MNSFEKIKKSLEVIADCVRRANEGYETIVRVVEENRRLEKEKQTNRFEALRKLFQSRSST